MSPFKQLIAFLAVSHIAYAYHVSIPATREKGEFFGCYKDLSMAKDKKIVGTYTVSDCVNTCNEHFYRYALLHTDNTCACSNFLGDIESNKLCNEVCNDCDIKQLLSDVYNTAVQMNGPPRNLVISNITDTHAVLTWQAPDSFFTIERYKVMANVLSTFSHSLSSSYSWINLYPNDTYRANIVTLHPGTKYNITVQADSFNVEGAKAFQVMTTLIGEPDSNPKAPTILNRNDTIMLIKLEPVYNNNGPVSSYLIVVIEANAVQAVQTENLKSYGQANADGISYYVAAELQPNRLDDSFIIGDSKSYGKYFNAPLQPDKNYHVMVGMLSRMNDREFVVYSETAGLQVDVVMSHMPTSDAEESSTVIVILSLAIVVISLLLVAGLIGFYFLRNRVLLNHRQRLNDNQELTIQGPMIDVENNGYIPEDELPQSTSHYKTLRERVWAIPQGALSIDQVQVIAYGKFGRVYAGVVVRGDAPTCRVAVYCVQDKLLSPLVKRSMLKELDVVVRATGSAHVLGLIGTCDRTNLAAFVFEPSEHSLKEHLIASRTSSSACNFSTLAPSQAVTFAADVANGMQHLHAVGVLHRRLCAAHVVIASGCAKIAGFGLTRFYRTATAPSALRHAAPEVLRGAEPTESSDVWAFGVLLWEIGAVGGTPHVRLPPAMLRERLLEEDGGRLAQLPHVRDTLYQVMLNCWQRERDERPTFAELFEHIDFIRYDDCLNFEMYPGFQYEPYDKDAEFIDGEVFMS